MKKPEAVYDDEYYANNQQEGDRIMLWFYARYAKRFLRKMTGRGQGSGALLDYGCGTGHLLKRFPEYKTFGFDISEYAMKSAKQNSPQTTFVSALSELGDRSLQMIITLHVLEHIEVPEQMLRQFNHKLQIGGYLIFVVPNKSAFGYRRKKENWFAFQDPTHVSLLGDTVWFEMVERTGFKIVKAGTDGPWDPPYWPQLPHWLNKLLMLIFCGPQIVLNRLLLPMRFGEDLILVAQKGEHI